MTERLNWLKPELESLTAQSLLRDRRCVEPLPGGRCRSRDRELINFGSNDYLGLAVELAAQPNTQSHVPTTGSTASALVCGRGPAQIELEQRLAAFEGQQAAIVFPTGYAANLGTIAALVGRGDAVFSDQLNHASLIDGCRLSRADLLVYEHADISQLESMLAAAETYRRRLIVSDALFSMDGDIAPLTELCDLAEKYDAMLMIDEAHATGVLGDRGRGVAEFLDVEQRIDVRVGTLSKAIGCQGGFVAGPQHLIDWLWNRARTNIFSTALAPAICQAAVAALDVIEQQPQRREHLQALSQRLRDRLEAVDADVPPKTCGPIIPVVLNNPQWAVTVTSQLIEAGFFVPPIRPPSVPAGTSRLRITLSAAHSLDDVDRLAQSLSKILGSRIAESARSH